MEKQILIIIPAYNPDSCLIEIVQELKKLGNQIIVVNDGSEHKDYFNLIKDQAIIITHERNQGKGQALKTGFEYVLNQCPKVIGVVTADADGQHTIQDIQKLVNTLKENPENFILGVRDFSQKQVPLKNKIGNYCSNFLFYLKTGQKLKDTQSGLRAIPIKQLKQLVCIKGERFEYEINVLQSIANKIRIKQVKICTVYSKKIKSHYKPITHSIQIIKDMITYSKKI